MNGIPDFTHWRHAAQSLFHVFLARAVSSAVLIELAVIAGAGVFAALLAPSLVRLLKREPPRTRPRVVFDGVIHVAASAAAKTGNWTIEIVQRNELHKFVVLPKRWIVERSIAWFNRCRRLAKDWENFNRKALAFLHLASIRLMLRKLCNPM